MREVDREAFGTNLARAMSFYDKPLKRSQLDLWFDLLADYELTDVLAALRSHMADPAAGRFSPKPADLISHMTPASQTLTANEAWAIALQAADERETVITCDLIDKAMESARAVLEIGDKIGARMAFIAAYDRLAAGVQPVWRLSLGHDRTGWLPVAERALSMGVIGHSRVEQIRSLTAPLAPEASAIAGLLTGPSAKSEQAMTEQNRQRFLKLRADFNSAMEVRDRQRAAERAAQAEAFEASRQQQLNALQAGAA